MTIHLGNPFWSTTVPHLLDPSDDEWLLGLLLRCDEANGWPAGATSCLASRRHLLPGQQAPPPAWPAGIPSARSLGGEHPCSSWHSHLDLPMLASALALPLASIEATTFRRELRRFFSLDQPGARLLGRAPAFRVCPQCIQEGGLLKRSVVLPLLRSCPDHQLWFQHRCLCGAPLQPFYGHTRPFLCAACGRPWAKLPMLRPSQEVVAFDATLLALYRALLEQQTEETTAGARRFIAWQVCKLGWPELPPGAFDRTVLPKPQAARWVVSIAQRVACLAALEIPPEQIIGLSPPRKSPPRCPCPNRACPRFGRVAQGNVHLFATYQKRSEYFYYCDQCGSRFDQEGRLVVTFDEGHGSQETRPELVARARTKLRAWKGCLAASCREMMANGEPITVKGTFARAGIPRDANLRARGLGLVSPRTRAGEPADSGW